MAVSCKEDDTWSIKRDNLRLTLAMVGTSIHKTVDAQWSVIESKACIIYTNRSPEQTRRISVLSMEGDADEEIVKKKPLPCNDMDYSMGSLLQ